MAGLQFCAQTTEEALAAGVAESNLLVVAPANQRVKVLGWGVYFDGTSTTAEAVDILVGGGTTAGTWTNTLDGTVGDADGCITKINGAAETIQSVAKELCTVEPTYTVAYDMVKVHPQAGYEMKYPIGQEPIVKGGDFVAIRCNAPAIVNVRCKLICEE